MEKNINKAKEVVLNGGVILYPTDTIWGIGCSAIIESAIKKIRLESFLPGLFGERA